MTIATMLSTDSIAGDRRTSNGDLENMSGGSNTVAIKSIAPCDLTLLYSK